MNLVQQPFNYHNYHEEVEQLRENIKQLIADKFIKSQQKVLLAALNYSEQAHYLQTRKNGAPYIIHPMIVGIKLIEWAMDYETVAAGLLHDVIEDTNCTHQDLLVAFGYQIADIVQTVSKVTKYSKKKRVDLDQEKLDNNYLVQVFVSMAKDLRALVVKLADRLHNMETLHFLRAEKQASIAKETLEIYAVLAGRIGMYYVKTQLEDLSFKIIDSHTYFTIKKQVQKLEANLKDTWTNIQQQMQTMLDLANIDYQIQRRIKGIYSIHKKMEKGYLLENIHDIFAVRIIVNSDLVCYQVLGLIHLNFIYIINAFKDYISLPKWNLYRSIHTTIIVNHYLIEFQIRTHEMHTISQMGLAAHWQYKEQGDYQKISQKLITEFLQGKQASVAMIKAISKNEMFDVYVANDNEFYVATTQTTILDLAYRYDPNQLLMLGNVFLNGEMVSFDTRLKKGDMVQFNYANHVKIEPNWIHATKNANLIEFINQTCQKRIANNQLNLNQLIQQINHLCPDQSVISKKISYLGYKKLVDLVNDCVQLHISSVHLFDLFRDDISVWKLAYKALKKALVQKVFLNTYFLPPEGILPNKVVITDCCSKFPNIPLIGILKNNILKVHAYLCPKASNHHGKLIVVHWDEASLKNQPRLFKVKTKIYGYMTPTITNQIIQTILHHKVIITKVDIQKNLDDAHFQGDLLLRIRSNHQLEQLVDSLKVKGLVREVQVY